MRWWLLVLTSACYSPPSYQHCAVSCEASGVCPGDFACLPAGNLQMVCHEPGKPQCPGLVEPMQDSGMMMGPDALDCFGHSAPPYLQTCLSTQAPNLIVPSAYTVSSATSFNTMNDCHYTLQQTGGPEICVRVAEDIRIKSSGVLRPHGARALLLLARHDIVIEMSGLVDVGGDNGQTPAGSMMCAGDPGTAGTNGGSGGGGGSFATAGGKGGIGELGATSIPGGNASPVVSNILTLRGGCAGGLAGTDPVTAIAKAGGAVYLLAGHDIIVAGEINASGDGAPGAPAFGGAGGGGSGGMIMLEAANAITIQPSAEIHALGGGGGGGGSSTSFGGAGRPATSPLMAGSGGNGGVGMPPGGNGGPPGDVGIDSPVGGGGGGGGTGVMRMFAPTITGRSAMTVSPPAP